MPSRLGLAAAVVISATWIAAFAQEPPVPPGFQTSVNYVQVDVSVLDRERQPVRGLRREDFVVTEDGQVQRLLAFSEIAVQPARATRPPWASTVFPDDESNNFENRRLIVLLIDDAQIRMGRMESRARAMAKQIVESLGPDDLAAIAFTRVGDGAQSFTSSRARLSAAADSWRAGNTGTPMMNMDSEPVPAGPTGGAAMEGYFQKNAVVALRSLVASLSTNPERRKAIIYLTPGLPLRFDQPSADTDILQETFRLAQQGNINIYPVDPAGLGGIDDAGAASSSQPDTSRQGVSLEQEFLRVIAANTSGFAVTNLESFRDQVKNIFSENSAYYLLGYESGSTRKDRGFRRIEVKVSRPDVVVRSRAGYYPPGRPATAEGKATGGLSASLSAAAAGTLPATGLRMQMTAAPFAMPGARDAMVVISVGVARDPALQGAAADQLDMFVAALDASSKARATERQQVSTTAGQPMRERVFRLRVPPGRYQFRAAAESRAEAKAGSVFLDLEVPDFARRPVSISGIALHLTRAGWAPSQTLDGPAPNLPSSSRRFLSSDQLRAISRIYQGGNDRLENLSARIRLTDEKGTAIHQADAPLPSECFAKDRSCELPFTLPVPSLSPGSYLLTIETSLRNDNARRDVAFTITR